MAQIVLLKQSFLVNGCLSRHHHMWGFKKGSWWTICWGSLNCLLHLPPAADGVPLNLQPPTYRPESSLHPIRDLLGKNHVWREEVWRKEVELKRGRKGRRDTEGVEKVRDTGGFPRTARIRRVSTETVCQTKPWRRVKYVSKPLSNSDNFLQGLLWTLNIFSASARHRVKFAITTSVTDWFWTVRNLETVLPRWDRMRVCPLLLFLCLLCDGRAQKFSAITVGYNEHCSSFHAV